MSEQDDTPPPPKESTKTGGETGSAQEDEAPKLSAPVEGKGTDEAVKGTTVEGGEETSDTEESEETSETEDVAPKLAEVKKDESATQTQGTESVQTVQEKQETQAAQVTQEAQETQTAQGTENTQVTQDMQDTQDTQDTQTEGGEKPFSPELERHVFEGEVNKHGNLVGYHYREGGVDHGDAKVASPGEPDENGVYKGRWTQEGRPDSKESSFFPDSYSKDDVRGAVREAFDNRTAGDKPNQWRGTTSDGLTVEGYLKSGTSLEAATEDDIKTAYPVRKEDEDEE